MKKISISGAAACLILLGLASAHAAGMGQDDMNKSGIQGKSGAMMHKDSMGKKSMSGASKKNGMMHKSGAMQKDMHGAMGKDAMQK